MLSYLSDKYLHDMNFFTEKPIEIVRKIEYTKATEKGEATFECETSKESTTVKWLKGTKPIVASDK